MYYVKKIVKYLSGVIFFILGFGLLDYYKLLTIDFLSVLKGVNVNIIWATFIIVSLPFFREFLPLLHKMIIRFFNIVEKKLFSDGMRLHFYKLKLRRRRFIRRFQFLRECCNPTLVLLPIWLVFIIILHIFTEKEYVVLFDEAKFSFFSSVILVCAVSIRDKITNYKSNLQEQFELYTDLMCSLEKMIWKIVKYNFPYYEEEYWSVNWCYTNERFRKIKDYIASDEKIFPIEILKEELEDLKNILESIKRLVITDKIETNERRLSVFVNDCFGKINLLKDLGQCDKKELEELCDNLYWRVLKPIRFPWRRDADLDIKIYTILLNKLYSKKDDDIYIDYYKRLLVDDDYEASYPKPIKKVKIKKCKSRD